MVITKQSIIGDVLDYNPGTAKFFLRSVCTAWAALHRVASLSLMPAPYTAPMPTHWLKS
jgi:hypothetical protein